MSDLVPRFHRCFVFAGTALLSGYIFAAVSDGGVLHMAQPGQSNAQHVAVLRPFPSRPEYRDKIKILLKRDGCYGSCPEYSVEISGNGTVAYEGKDHVRVVGHATSSVPGHVVENLILRINAMRFFSLRSHYTSDLCCPDCVSPSTVVVSEPGREKSVLNICGAPTALDEFEKAIDRLAGTQRWIFIDAAEVQHQIDAGGDAAALAQEYMFGAIGRDDPEIIRVLVAHGVDVNAEAPGAGSDHQSYLMVAVIGNSYKAAKALLEAGAKLDEVRPPYTGTPAQVAGLRGLAMCKLVLDHGADVNGQQGNGVTMLMGAAGQGHLDAVKFLLAAGARINLRAGDGTTALAEAKRFQQLLRSVGDAAGVRRMNVLIHYLQAHGALD